jgi:hypothetical protein
MKNFFYILLIFPSFLFSEWHSWKHQMPDEGQRYMIIVNIPQFVHSQKKFLVIQTWNKYKENYIVYPLTGWFDATDEDILKWFAGGDKVIYLPKGRKSIEKIF